MNDSPGEGPSGRSHPSSHADDDDAGDLLAIAHVLRPHGIRGELSSVPLAPPVVEPADLILDRRLYSRSAGGNLREWRGAGVRPHQDRWLIALEGVATRDDAERLRGCDLCLPRAELPDLPEGWYWEADLRRCRVIDSRLGELGQVGGLEVGGPQPQLEIQRPDGGTVLIPWVRAYVTAVDLNAAAIHTTLPDGYPGLDE